MYSSLGALLPLRAGYTWATLQRGPAGTLGGRRGMRGQEGDTWGHVGTGGGRLEKVGTLGEMWGHMATDDNTWG